MSNLFTITTLEQLEKVIIYVKDNIDSVGNIAAFDTESDGPNPIINTITGWSISLFETEGFYIVHSCMTDERGLCTESPNKIPKEGQSVDKKLLQCVSDEFIKRSLEFLEMLKEYQLLMHNATFDVIIVRRNFGIDYVKNTLCDTMLLKHTIDCDRPHGLKDCGVKYFGEDSTDEQEELGGSVIRNGGKWTKTDKWIWYGDLYYAGKYAAMDTVLTLRLFNHLDPMLDDMKLREFFYEDEVMPLMRYGTIPMKDTGFKIDVNHFKRAKLRLQAEIDELDRQIRSEVADITDPMEQVHLDKKYPAIPKRDFAQYLIQEVGHNLPINPKTGGFSTDKGSIKTWAEKEIKKATEDQIKIIWYIQGECDKVPTYLIHKVQRRLWEDKNDKPIVNLGSAKQFEFVVNKKWGVTSPEKTKSGDPSFNAAVIERITLSRMQTREKLTEDQAKDQFSECMECDDLPIEADWFVKFLRKKKLEKLVSSFINGILELAVDGRIHTSMLQHGTTSGRYASTKPNLQQLPSHSALGMVIKKGFIA